MKELILKIGETIKILGQRQTHLVVTNVDGEIYSKTDYKRDKEDNHSQETEGEPNRLTASRPDTNIRGKPQLGKSDFTIGGSDSGSNSTPEALKSQEKKE